MLIATIGSCLSRNITDCLIGSRVLNSVYHNRSDRLVDILSTGGTKLKPLDELCERMAVGRTETGEFSPPNLLRNQSAEGFGRHRLPDGIPFHRSLVEKRFDLILIDNFMDLGARLYRLPGGERYFCRYTRSQVPAGFRLGRRLTPQESASNFREVVTLLRAAQPSAHIVFIHFPINNYPAGRKAEWARQLDEVLDLSPYADVLALKEARPRYPDGEPQHFHFTEYMRYAARILALHGRHRFPRLFRGPA
ncbi:hypothetical protein [Shinella pollutisoli]|uniref:hypothetical protein n=1 Tax=Shinella pollutisoli TaxID=2250594 RepID=UPI0036D32077